MDFPAWDPVLLDLPDWLPFDLRWYGITYIIGFFAGAVVGIPQSWLLRRFGSSLSQWWVPISSLAWGIFFPGAVSGLFLARRLKRTA